MSFLKNKTIPRYINNNVVLLQNKSSTRYLTHPLRKHQILSGGIPKTQKNRIKIHFCKKTESRRQKRRQHQQLHQWLLNHPPQRRISQRLMSLMVHLRMLKNLAVAMRLPINKKTVRNFSKTMQAQMLEVRYSSIQYECAYDIKHVSVYAL